MLVIYVEEIPILRKRPRRRNRLDVVFDVLGVVEAGVDRPTKIMFAANISWVVLKEILSDLQKRGLIEVMSKGGRTHVKITARGKEMLNAYREFESVLEEERLSA
ncbi:MAG: winged helix-turn-helix domain-containing protein [Nitrososphaerota archaeon]